MPEMTSNMEHGSSDFAEEKNNDATHVVHKDVLPSPDDPAEAMAHGKTSPWSMPLLKLFGFCAVACLCSTMNGKDCAVDASFDRGAY